MKRSHRIALLSHYFNRYPMTQFTLNRFAEEFGVSKTSLSEDIEIIRKTLEENHLGTIESIVGPCGGVRYVPGKPTESLMKDLKDLEAMLQSPHRIILEEFVYYGDLLSQREPLEKLAYAMYSKVREKVDGVLTVETKGITLAYSLASLLNVKTVVARKSNRISEGNTLSVHYKSGSNDIIRSMYVTKWEENKLGKVVLVDDFIRGGGTLSGLQQLSKELGAQVVNTFIFMEDMDVKKKNLAYQSIFQMRRKGGLNITLNPDW